jgi:membrane glycosyltransferase
MVGLLFGKSVVWGGQSRDAQGLSWTTAAQNLAQMLFGVLVCGALLVIEPAVRGGACR